MQRQFSELNRRLGPCIQDLHELLGLFSDFGRDFATQRLGKDSGDSKLSSSRGKRVVRVYPGDGVAHHLVHALLQESLRLDLAIHGVTLALATTG